MTSIKKTVHDIFSGLLFLLVSIAKLAGYILCGWLLLRKLNLNIEYGKGFFDARDYYSLSLSSITFSLMDNIIAIGDAYTANSKLSKRKKGIINKLEYYFGNFYQLTETTLNRSVTTFSQVANFIIFMELLQQREFSLTERHADLSEGIIFLLIGLSVMSGAFLAWTVPNHNGTYRYYMHIKQLLSSDKNTQVLSSAQLTNIIKIQKALRRYNTYTFGRYIKYPSMRENGSNKKHLFYAAVRTASSFGVGVLSALMFLFGFSTIGLLKEDDPFSTFLFLTGGAAIGLFIDLIVQWTGRWKLLQEPTHYIKDFLFTAFMSINFFYGYPKGIGENKWTSRDPEFEPNRGLILSVCLASAFAVTWYKLLGHALEKVLSPEDTSDENTNLIKLIDERDNSTTIQRPQGFWRTFFAFGGKNEKNIELPGIELHSSI